MTLTELSAWIACVLTLLPGWYGERETRLERAVRMQRVGVAIARAVKTTFCTPDAGPLADCWRRAPLELALWLVAQGYSESRFALFVHDGSCNRAITPHCDQGDAATPWQIQTGYRLTIERQRAMIGMAQAPTDRAAKEAAIILARSYRMCGTFRGMLSIYATGSSCYWHAKTNGPKARERLYYSLLSRIPAEHRYLVVTADIGPIRSGLRPSKE